LLYKWFFIDRKTGGSNLKKPIGDEDGQEYWYISHSSPKDLC
jgi:hypothetical protein